VRRFAVIQTSPLAHPAPGLYFVGMTSKTQTSPIPPSPDLIRDLLDPALTSIEVMQRHTLDPHAFRDVVRSQAFCEAAEALRDADQERTELLTPLMHARALHTLARIANQPTTTPSQTESARRASTALLKVGRHSVPTLHPPTSNAEPTPRGADLQSASRAQPEPLPPTPAPNPNPLADITGDPTMTLADSLHLIAEIEAIRRGLPLPHGPYLQSPAPPRGAELQSASPSHRHSDPQSPAAQLMARAGDAS